MLLSPNIAAALFAALAASAVLVSTIPLAAEEAADGSATVTRPEAFHPDVNPAGIRCVTYSFEVATYFASKRDFLRILAVTPLSRWVLRQRHGDGYGFAAYEQAGACERDGFNSAATFITRVTQPDPTSYQIALTVEVGPQVRTWRLTRPYTDLREDDFQIAIREDGIGEHSPPSAETLLWERVVGSLAADLADLGNEACAALVLQNCPKAPR